MVWEGRREEGSGWGTQVCLWRIQFNIWQNQYNIVKFKNKIKFKKKSSEVEISHSSFKELFSAIEKYCYWLDPDKGTLRHEE